MNNAKSVTFIPASIQCFSRPRSVPVKKRVAGYARVFDRQRRAAHQLRGAGGLLYKAHSSNPDWEFVEV